MSQYLRQRIDHPFAWVKVFGGLGLFLGAVVGFEQEGLSGALGGAVVAGLMGAIAGLVVWVMLWVVSRLAGGLSRPLQRPDLWGRPLACTCCEWHTTPEGPWCIRDCMYPPVKCPSCGSDLKVKSIRCPNCGTVPQGLFRWPRSVRGRLDIRFSASVWVV
jgi:hypothetical protein